MKKELSRFQVNLTSGYSLSSHPQQHLAAALAAAQQRPRVSHSISVSLGSAHAPATVTLSGLTGHPQQQAAVVAAAAAKGHPHESQQQHITQTVFLSPPASGSPSGTAPNLALNLATNNHSVPITPTTPGAIPSIAGLPMMAVKLDASSNPHLAASIGVKRQSSTIALAAPTDYRHDGDSIAENGNILKEKSRRMDSPERRPSAATMD